MSEETMKGFEQDIREASENGEIKKLIKLTKKMGESKNALLFMADYIFFTMVQYQNNLKEKDDDDTLPFIYNKVYFNIYDQEQNIRGTWIYEVDNIINSGSETREAKFYNVENPIPHEHTIHRSRYENKIRKKPLKRLKETISEKFEQDYIVEVSLSPPDISDE